MPGPAEAKPEPRGTRSGAGWRRERIATVDFGVSYFPTDESIEADQAAPEQPGPGDSDADYPASPTEDEQEQ